MCQSIYELLNDCTVRLILPNTVCWGTGFFVSPGLILTCSHVVKGFEEQLIQIEWHGNLLTEASLVEILSEPLDLALLRCDLLENLSPPCVWLDQNITTFDDLYIYGYPDHFLQGCSVTIECEGTVREQGIDLIKFKAGQIRPGHSGSPVLNKRTGKVCGIVSETRGKSTDLGGLAISVSTVFGQWAKLQDKNLTFHQQDDRWRIALETRLSKEILDFIIYIVEESDSRVEFKSYTFPYKDIIRHHSEFQYSRFIGLLNDLPSRSCNLNDATIFRWIDEKLVYDGSRLNLISGNNNGIIVFPQKSLREGSLFRRIMERDIFQTMQKNYDLVPRSQDDLHIVFTYVKSYICKDIWGFQLTK